MRVTNCRPGLAAAGETGSAIVEFTVLVVTLLVPLVYLVTTVAKVQAAAYAATTAARESARAFVTADTVREANARSRVAMRLALADHNVAAGSARLDLTCLDGGCLQPGSAVQTRVAVSVELPGLPSILGPQRGVIPVTATAVAPVDRTRPGP